MKFQKIFKFDEILIFELFLGFMGGCMSMDGGYATWSKMEHYDQNYAIIHPPPLDSSQYIHHR